MPTVVVPAVTAAHAEPFHFESVPVLTASIRNEIASPSTSAAFEAARSVAYVISNAVFCVPPCRVLIVVSVGASFTAVMLVVIDAVAAEMAVEPPLEVVSTVARDCVPAVVEKLPAYVPSRARIVRLVGAPLKLATGTNLTRVAAERASAVAPSLTVPISNQLVPLLVEYCHPPWVAAFAAFDTMA